MSRERVVKGKRSAKEPETAAEILEQLEFQTGRRAPFSQVGDWVLLAKIRHPAKVLYWALTAHVSSSRDDTVVWPSQDTLAEILGYSDGRKLREYIEELIRIGAIVVRKRHFYVGGLRRERSIYVVHQTPPEDYDGHESLTDYYTERKTKRAESARALVAAVLADAEDPDTPGGRNEPPGKSGENAADQGAEMGPLDGAEMGPLVGGRNGPPNQTKQPDAVQPDGGGNPPPPPNPPADLTAGDVCDVPPSVVGSSGDQQTARAPRRAPRPRPVAGRLRAQYELERRAAAACTDCDDAGLTPSGASCPHGGRQRTPETGLDSTLTDEPVSAR